VAATPETRIRIVAENLARAALAELRRDVQVTGTASGTASLGFDRMVVANNRLVTSTAGSRKGLNLMENGLRTLAFQAAGIPGPLGKVAAGLGLLGAGSLVVTGAVAGAGAIALAWKFASAAADALTASADRLNQSWRDIIAQGKPVVAIQNQLTAAQTEATAAQEKFNRLTSTVPSPRGPVARGTPGEIALAQNALDAANRVVGARRQQLAEAKVQLIADAQDDGTKWAQAFLTGIRFLDLNSQLRTLFAAAPQFKRLGTEAGQLYGNALRAAMAEVLERDLATGRLGNLRLPFVGIGGGGNVEKGGLFGKLATPEKFAPREFFLSDLEKESGKALKKAATPTGVLIAQSFLSAVQLAQQGGPGAIFGAGGAMLSGLSGIEGLASLGPIGIIASTFGSLISLFDRKDSERERAEERRHRELLGTLHEGFLRVTVINADGTTEAGLYEMRRAERLGGEPRLGGI
jgi:hypothetical protein